MIRQNTGALAIAMAAGYASQNKQAAYSPRSIAKGVPRRRDRERVRPCPLTWLGCRLVSISGNEIGESWSFRNPSPSRLDADILRLYCNRRRGQAPYYQGRKIGNSSWHLECKLMETHAWCCLHAAANNLACRAAVDRFLKKKNIFFFPFAEPQTSSCHAPA